MRKKTVIALLLVFAIIMTGMLVACNEECTEHIDADGNLKCDNCDADMSTDDGGNGDGGTTTPSGKATYTVTIKSMAGVPIKTTAYVMQANGDLKSYIATDEATGTGSKEIEVGEYYIELGSLPDGYVADAKYYFQKSVSGEYTANIVVGTEVVSGEHKRYELGSVMRDFTVNTVDGTTFTLSEALKEYDGVLLNFFYTTCGPCVNEFPYLNEAAGLYSDDIAVICVDTNGQQYDTFNYVKDFYYSEGYFAGTFDEPLTNLKMGVHENSLFSAFNASGYPTSVMIDRYGVICLIETGGVPYLSPFKAMFDYFSADNYTQKLFNSLEELTPKKKPGELGFTQPASSAIAAVMNGANMTDVVYYPENEAIDADTYWPFDIGEKDGQACVVSTNNTAINDVEDNYATVAAMNVDVALQQGQALSLDYYCSTERGGDYFYVLVDGELIYTISGEGTEWEKCYPFVATKDDTYKVSFVYSKDYDTDKGDDCIYLKNFDIVNASAIDKETYIPRNAVSEPTEMNDGYLNYAEVVFNENDGYYHVNNANGPLLLANLMNYIVDDNSANKTSLYLYSYENAKNDGWEDEYARFVNFCSYASNSEIGGYCTVNAELKGYLEDLNILYKGGVMDDSANGWLRFCRYYDAYGTSNQLEDPIAGLSPFSAYKAVVNETVGEEVYPNSVTYKTIIMPRGKLFSFTSEEGGVYRILSTGTEEVDGWIFDEEGFYTKVPLLEADHIERLVDTDCDGVYSQIEYGSQNVCMNYYFEPGKEYFIDIAYYDTTQAGTINFKIERLGDTYTQFRYASPAPFTYYINPETGEEVFDLIAGGVTPVFNEEDGYYYVGQSKLYVDITMPIITGFLSDSIEEAVEKGAFDFTRIAQFGDDGKVSGYIPSIDVNGNPIVDTSIVDGKEVKTPRILVVKDALGNDTEIKDYTAKMQEYIDTKMIVADGEPGSEASLSAGCIAVDKDMAVMLQYLVDAHSFRGVPNAWTKLCYYFEYLGPQSND